MLGEGDYLAAITEAIAIGAHSQENIVKSIERTHKTKLRVDGKRRVAHLLNAMMQHGILQLNSNTNDYSFNPSFPQALTKDEAIMMRIESIRNGLIAELADRVEQQQKTLIWMREEIARLEEAKARVESEKSQLNATINQIKDTEKMALWEREQLTEELRRRELGAVNLKVEYRCLEQTLNQCDVRRKPLLKGVEDSEALLESKRAALEHQRTTHKHQLDILEMEKEQADVVLTREITAKVANVAAERARLEKAIDLKRQQIEIQSQIKQLESQKNLIAKLVDQ